jgi:hypothetical protein
MKALVDDFESFTKSGGAESRGRNSKMTSGEHKYKPAPVIER